MNLRLENRLLGSGLVVHVKAAAILVVTLLLGLLFTANTAVAGIVYNSVPSPLPDNVASEGPEAYGFAQLGDGLNLVVSPGQKLNKVTVVLSSWACTSGNWYTAGTCATTPGATYTINVTLNIYSVVPGNSLEGNPAPARERCSHQSRSPSLSRIGLPPIRLIVMARHGMTRGKGFAITALLYQSLLV